MPTFDEFANVDTIVLGCTHFPLIKSHIQAQLSQNVTLVDSGAAVANRVVSLLDSKNETGVKQAYQLYSTRVLNEVKQCKLNELGFENIHYIDV